MASSTWKLCTCGEPIPAGTDQCGPCYRADREAERAAMQAVLAERQEFDRAQALDEGGFERVWRAERTPQRSLAGPVLLSILLGLAGTVALILLHIV
jgi:alkanesulfonate monooxygenase SsuD/methylene tetrahydromethanopterin reductase-like flavin-dependent oxidoreductase (luciferase family)